MVFTIKNVKVVTLSKWSRSVNIWFNYVFLLVSGHPRPPRPSLCGLRLPGEGVGPGPQHRPPHRGALQHQVQGAQATGGLYVFRWVSCYWSKMSNAATWLAVSHPWTELDHVSYNPLYVDPLVHKLKSMSSSCLDFREFLLRNKYYQLASCQQTLW